MIIAQTHNCMIMGRIDQCQPPEDNAGKSIAVSRRAGLPSKSHLLVNSPYVQLCLAVNGGDRRQGKQDHCCEPMGGAVVEIPPNEFYLSARSGIIFCYKW